MPPTSWAGALTLFDDPTMTRRVTGAAPVTVASDSWSPVGTLASVTSTVCGFSWTLVDVFAPDASVAVSTSDSDIGYSWSGAGNDPLATPTKSCMGCTWQALGQWLMSNDHDSRVAASVPSSASVAWPEKAMVSPTFQLPAPVGASITGTGAVFGGPTTIVAASVSNAPAWSVTRSRTVYSPLVVNARLVAAVAASSNAPSLSRSQA